MAPDSSDEDVQHAEQALAAYIRALKTFGGQHAAPPEADAPGHPAWVSVDSIEVLDAFLRQHPQHAKVRDKLAAPLGPRQTLSVEAWAETANK